jgi:hypothetical protein
MNKALNIFNWGGILILLTITLAPLFGQDAFGRTITYGVGLGDLFYVLMSLIALIIFIVLINLKKIKSNQKSITVITTILYLTILFFIYSFTLGRGTEYKWNGELLYPSSEGLERIKEMQKYDLGYNESIELEGETETQVDSSSVRNSDIKFSIDDDKLEIYNYPNLTAWGGLILKSFEGELKIIEATHNAELGFTKRIYYLEKNKIHKIEYIGHSAEWAKYEKDYPSDEYEWNPDKMTYSDTTFIIDASNDVDIKTHEKLKQEGIEIIEFIKKEKITAANTVYSK